MNHKKKLFVFGLILIVLFTVSATSASGNVTNVISNDDSMKIVDDDKLADSGYELNAKQNSGDDWSKIKVFVNNYKKSYTYDDTFEINITNDGDSASAKGYVEKTAKVTLDSDTTLKIYCVDVTSSMSEQYGIPVGVYVNSVITGGPAAKAGIQQYDVITKVDGEDASTTQKLKAILATKSAGDQITVTYQRPNSRNL